MEFKHFLILLLFLTLINSAFAGSQAEISLQKSEYSGKETMLIGVFLDELPVRAMSVADLSLSEGKIAPIIAKGTNGHYYFYFDLPELADGDYKVNLNLLYNVNNILKTVTFSKEFSINNELRSMSIRPAALKVDAAKSQDYQIYLKNNGNNAIAVSLNEDIDYASLSKAKIIIEKNTQKSFFIIVDKNKITSNATSLVNIDYDGMTFNLPIIITNFKEKTPEITEPINQTLPIKNNETKITNETSNISDFTETKADTTANLSFISETIDIKAAITKNKFIGGPLTLKNYLNRKLTGIRFSISGNASRIIRLNSTFFSEIEANSQITQYVFINERKDAELGVYDGVIQANSNEGHSASIPVEITVNEENLGEIGKSIIDKITKEEETAIKEFEVFNFSAAEKEKKDIATKTSKAPLLIMLLIAAIFAFLFYKFMTRNKPRTFEEYISRLEKK